MKVIPAGRWNGKNLATRNFDRVTLAEIVYPPNYKIARHAHESSLFYLVQAGSFTQYYGNKVREGKPANLIYLRADEAHADTFHRAGARSFVIEIENNLLRLATQESKALGTSATFAGGLPTWFATRMYSEYLEIDQFSPLAIEGLVLELIAECARVSLRNKTGRPPRWLEQTRELIHASAFEQISLKGISKIVDVHPTHLARTFRQHYGFTIGNYLRRLRVEAASNELISTETPLAQIAANAGFYDQSHFSRIFKRFTKLTPSEYRARSRRRTR